MASIEELPELLRREAIGAAVMARAEICGGYLSWAELTNFPMPDGEIVRLVDPGKGGIWNPRTMAATLSILTSPDGPYADTESEGFLQYHYQSGPEGGKNLKLRTAMELSLPVLRLEKVAKGTYAPIFPVYVVGDNPVARVFTINLDEVMRLVPGGVPATPLEKLYAARVVQQRVHQPAFRARVMLAYDRACTVCSLRHVELLDAAHIVGDAESGGEPVVTNGLSLCKIHHAAFDRRLLGITPDYEVRINQRLLDEVDGPMLRHGLQEMHERKLNLPKAKTDRPDPERLNLRFATFQAS